MSDSPRCGICGEPAVTLTMDLSVQKREEDTARARQVSLCGVCIARWRGKLGLWRAAFFVGVVLALLATAFGETPDETRAYIEKTPELLLKLGASLSLVVKAHPLAVHISAAALGYLVGWALASPTQQIQDEILAPSGERVVEAEE